MRLRRSLAAAALAASVVGGASAANAGTIFFDDFNSYAYSLNWVPPGPSPKWTVASGSVDIHGVGTPYTLLPASYGKFIDLDGSTGHVGTLDTTKSFAAGTYTVSFVLAGNQRGDGPKTTVVSLGGWSQSITLAANAAPSVYSYKITTTGGTLDFASLVGGNANKGNLLDNVSVSTAVPELSTWAMLGFGFSGIGYAMMRRRKTPIALA